MLSYAITTYNEINELKSLLPDLLNKISKEDEIVIQLDTKATDEVREYVNTLKEKIIIIEFPLDNHFANFKNNLKKYCTQDWIFQLDADEKIVDTLLYNLHAILELNDDKDVILVPRINTVIGMTSNDVKTYGWRINEKGWINFPDLQSRLYKRNEDILWVNPVHETLSGFKNLSRLPAEEDYCLLHEKTIERQRKQNEFYINTFNK